MIGPGDVLAVELHFEPMTADGRPVTPEMLDGWIEGIPGASWRESEDGGFDVWVPNVPMPRPEEPS